MLSINIAVIRNFIKYFNSKQIEEIAVNVGFNKRCSGKLAARTFFKAFTIGLWNCQNATLTHTANICEDIQEGLSITKQALHKKLETGAGLLKEMFNLSLKHSIRYSSLINTSNVLNRFGNVIICDSTFLTLPNKLNSVFRGNGGKAKSESSVKVQAEFNITTRSFRRLKVTEGVESDHDYVNSLLETVEENDLIIHDRGYFSLKFFKDIESKKAYYLTRIPSFTAFFPDLERAKDKPLLIDDVLDLKKDTIDTKIFIGTEKKTRTAVRIVAVKLPLKVINERIRKANKNAASRGKTLTKRQKLLLCWNIVITNVPINQLSTQLVLELYRIRWQIEIIFKAWKSHLRLRNIAHGGKAQVECLLYGRLIVITLMTAVYSQFYSLMLLKKHRELSILKFFSLLTLKAKDVIGNVCSSIDNSYALLGVFSKIAEKSLYEKRKRQSTLETILNHEKLVLANCG